MTTQVLQDDVTSAFIVWEQTTLYITVEEGEQSAASVTGTILVTASEEADVQILTVGEPGPRGIQGPEGPEGPVGPRGPIGDLNFVHDQILPSATWDINHNLDKFPSATVLDSTGDTVLGSIEYLGSNDMRLIFTAAFSGTAYLN